MCNEYKNDKYSQILLFDNREYRTLDSSVEYRDHVFPKYQARILRLDGEKISEDVKTWGFQSPYNEKAVVTNIRNYSSPFWRNRLAKIEGRCLVPFSQFCEWNTDASGKKERRWFSVNEKPVSMFAGVWSGDVFAFLTCDANELVKPIHPKAMPVILLEEDYERWLTADWSEAEKLAHPFPSQLMSVQ